VHTNYGWHIIKIDDRRKKEPPAFDTVKDTIINSLVVRKAQDQATEMRSKAQVEYVDAGIKKQVEEQKQKQKKEDTAKTPAEAPATAPAAPAAPAAPPEPKQ
jgi:peptidyl-prolyl cis-trans isomerase C